MIIYVYLYVYKDHDCLFLKKNEVAVPRGSASPMIAYIPCETHTPKTTTLQEKCNPENERMCPEKGPHSNPIRSIEIVYLPIHEWLNVMVN